LSTVTNTNDSGPGSLRDAIASAADGATIRFSKALDGDRITLTGGALAISTDLQINGPGAGLLTISGGGTSGVFAVTADDLNVTISGLTIANGNATTGGGISITSGTLTLGTTEFTGDGASGGTGGAGGFGSPAAPNGNPGTGMGGAVFIGQLGTAVIKKVTLLGNFASTSDPDISGTYLT
jgi:hypothetical protein